MQLESILNDIINNSFPELMNEDIRVEWKNLNDTSMEYGGLTGEGYYIVIDTSLKQVNDSIIIGGVVRELCHILTDLELVRENLSEK